MTCLEREKVKEELDYLERKCELIEKRLEQERKEHRSYEKVKDAICIAIIIFAITISVVIGVDFMNYLDSLNYLSSLR